MVVINSGKLRIVKNLTIPWLAQFGRHSHWGMSQKRVYKSITENILKRAIITSYAMFSYVLVLTGDTFEPLKC